MSAPPAGDYGRKYRGLKRKIKLLLYEQECFQMELRKAQRKFIKVSRDKSFLLERLLQYEDVNEDSSDTEATASSDNSEPEVGKILETPPQKKKITPSIPSASQSQSTNALQTGNNYSRSPTPTQSPYLETIASPGFPTEYLSSFPDQQTPLRPQTLNPKGERGKRERKGKLTKVKRTKVPAPLSSARGDRVSIGFPPPGDSLCPLASKLAPSIPSTVPQEMFSHISDDENVDRDDDLVIDIPE